MLFYRVIKAPDWRTYYATGITRELVLGELVTASEIKRHGLGVLRGIFEPVEIPKRRTYWFFGARFERQNRPENLTDEAQK